MGFPVIIDTDGQYCGENCIFNNPSPLADRDDRRVCTIFNDELFYAYGEPGSLNGERLSRSGICLRAEEHWKNHNEQIFKQECNLACGLKVYRG